jgi:hypothetical protein
MSEVRLQIVRGAAKTYTLQARRLDQSVPTEFYPGMVIYSEVTRFNDQTGVLFRPATAWYNAGIAEFSIGFRSADSAAIENGVFKITTYVVLNGEPTDIFVGQVEVISDARASTNPLPDLVTTVEAEQLCGTLTDAEYERLPGFIYRASQAIRTYTNQSLTYRLHDEVFASREGSKVVLRQLPVREVDRVLCDPKAVLTVRNGDPTNQRASCWLTSTGDFLNGFVSSGLGFGRVSYGVAAADAFVTWADAPTIGAVRDAVAALGSGWQATINQGVADDPASDLQGRTTSKQPCDRGSAATFVMHVRRIGDYMLSDDSGILEFTTPWSNRDVWLWPDSPTEVFERSTPVTAGACAYRVVYYAGYKTVTGGWPSSEMPGDLMDAVGIVLQAAFAKKKLNPLYTSRTLADFSYSMNSDSSFYIPEEARQILANYRDPGQNLDP